MGSCLLFLLVSLLLIGEQLHSWLGYRGSHRDRRYGLESRSVLRRWHSGDGEELHSWLGYHGSHRDRRYGLESQSVLRRWHSGDGVNRGHHVAPSGAEGSRAPPMPEVAPSSSKDSLRVVCNDGDLLCTIPTNTARESHSWGERLRRPRRLMVNPWLLKRMVLPGARPTPVGWLLLATKASFDEGTIETSRVKARYKFPFLAHQLSVFFAPTRYRVVKITHSCSKVVLCTTKLKDQRMRPEGG
jgi:hypothetical protein